MNGHNIIAVYGSRPEAERARDRLIENGIPGADIRMSATETGAAATGMAGSPAATATPRREGFWDWLFGRDVPERDRGWYEANLREGRTVLSVLVRDGEQQQRIAEILEEFDPIDFDEETAAGGAPALDAGAMPLGSTPAWDRQRTAPMERPAADTALGSPAAWSRQGGVSTPAERDSLRETAIAPEAGAVGSAERGAEMGAGEQVIPVVKEELSVGKRASERRYRIRTYVVETPIEKEITLRDERVVVEHRPVSGSAAATDAQMPQDREYEVVERHEEPVVEKRARNIEEVVVRRDADERTEKVRDTVRQTRVDVENEAGGRADNLERPLPQDRKG
jgi:stress response protein YsnF